MAAKTEKTIEKTIKFKGRIITMEEHTIVFENGKTAYREIARHNGGVGILAIDKNDCILMVKQYRKPYEEFLLEIPAGKLEKGEIPVECAERELMEETGCRADCLEKLSEIYPSPGFLDERLFVFRARNVEESGVQKLDEDEHLEVLHVPFAEALQMVQRMEIKDGKTMIAILLEAEERNHRR